MRTYHTPNLGDITSNQIVIDSIPRFDIEDYDLSNPKELTRYFFNIERICRNSYLYKTLIRFLRNNVDMDHCSFYENIHNISDEWKVRIQIHHTPFTLYDIVVTIYNKRLALHESISENQVAKEVMYNHYKLLVGLVPLSETVHELIHNGFLFFPTTSVFGYYQTFVKQYEQFIEPDTMRTLKQNEELSQTYDHMKETKVLTVNPVFIDVSGAYKIPKTEDLLVTLKKMQYEEEKKYFESLNPYAKEYMKTSESSRELFKDFLDYNIDYIEEAKKRNEI